MRPSALLCALSLRAPAAPVAPWPPVRTAFDRWLASELDDLRAHPHRHTSASWLSCALDLAVAAQARAMAGISTARRSGNDYLDDTVELLDACAGLRERVESIKCYTNSLTIAYHSLEAADTPSAAAVRKATVALESCEAMERRCADLGKCGSNLRKLGEKLALVRSPEGAEEELDEALTGSRAVVLLVVGVLGVALSFKSRRGVPSVGCGKSPKWSWPGALHELQREAKEELEKRRKDGEMAMRELEAAAAAARGVRLLIAGGRWERREMRMAVERMRMRCGELEERLRRVGERIDELYRQLISVRVSLLGLEA